MRKIKNTVPLFNSIAKSATTANANVNIDKWYATTSKYDSDIALMEQRIVLLIDEITPHDYEALFHKFMACMRDDDKKPINLWIHSPGGDVFATMAIYDLMRNYPVPINTVGAGCCASGASVLLSAGVHRSIFEHSWVMMHQAFGQVEGDTKTVNSRAGFMVTLEKQFARIFSNHTGMSVKEVEELSNTEKWFTAKDALKYKLVDEVIKSGNVKNNGISNNTKNARRK